MATSFSANQYDNAFISNRLGNWECPSQYKEEPNPQKGFTQVIATDEGHLKPGVPRSRSNPWGNFIGTWDIPKKIPGNCARVGTARTTYAQEKLQREHQDAEKVLTGDVKNANRRVMREGVATISKPCPDDARRSGADAPASKMIPATPPSNTCHHNNRGSATPKYREPTPQGYRAYTPQKYRTPTPDRASNDAYRVDKPYSPIPGVPDILEVLNLGQQGDAQALCTTRQNNGISAL